MRSEEEIRADAADERPFSNGTEYEVWADRYCYRCRNDSIAGPVGRPEVFCPIITVALVGPAWPKEWTRDRVNFVTVDGKPAHYEVVDTCTEFEERRDPDDGPEPEPEPPPVCDGQLDLIDAYLDTALAELTPRMVTS